MLVLKTTIRSEVITKALSKGLSIAFIGLMLLWALYLILRPESFNFQGLTLWLLSITLIAIGLIPYKMKKALEIMPEILQIDDDKIELFKKGRVRTKILWKDVASFEYVETLKTYGVRFIVKNLKKETVFFEHFSKRSFDKLSEWDRLERKKPPQ